MSNLRTTLYDIVSRHGDTEDSDAVGDLLDDLVRFINGRNREARRDARTQLLLEFERERHTSAHTQPEPGARTHQDSANTNGEACARETTHESY